MRAIYGWCLAVLLGAGGAAGQTQNSANTLKLDKRESLAAAKIGDLAWMAGHWVGTGLGGVSEEVWSPPLGNNMMGMFRVVRDGKVSFYELCAFVEEGGSLAMKVKHFNPDLTGREEKGEVRSFPLVKLDGQAAYFDGLTYRKLADGRLEAFVVIKKKATGEMAEERFEYTRFDAAKGYPK